MPVALPPLPYAEDALEPYYSKQTIGFHYGKHHKAYVDNLNGLIAGSEMDNEPLENIVRWAAGNPERVAMFNNAAQAWNHTFFWRSMTPVGGRPTGSVSAAIDAAFGSLDGLVAKLKPAAVGRFGSGWAWLVAGPDGRLDVISTPNAETPITMGLRPLLTIDVWEHAYYLDYQNRRADYVQTFLDRLANWQFVAQNL